MDHDPSSCDSRLCTVQTALHLTPHVPLSLFPVIRESA